MANVFISYSRKDKEAAHTLAEACKAQELDVWIDWEGIEPTTDWWKEIEKGIEQADNFLFLISPDSALSPICKREIEHAVKNGKRLIPVVVRDIKSDESPSELRSLHWLFLRETDDFPSVFEKLVIAVKTDYIWVQFHRRLQVKALEWERSDRENSLLLRGKDLQDAESQLVGNSSKEPQPTDLQREYVLNSRQESDRQRVRNVSITTIAIIIMVVLTVVAIIQAGVARNAEAVAVSNANTAEAASTLASNNAATAQANAEEAQRQATISRSQALAANSQLQESKNQLSLLLALEAFDVAANLPHSERLSAEQAVRDSLSQVSGIPLIGSGPVFSPDGRWLATVNLDSKAQVRDMRDPTAEPLVLRRYASTLFPLAFSPNGRWLATESFDTVRLWNMNDPTTEPIVLRGQVTSVEGLGFEIRKIPIFSPHGRWLATRSNDATARLWDMNDPMADPIVLRGHESSIDILNFSPDERWLATRSDSTIRLWNLEMGQVVSIACKLGGRNFTSAEWAQFFPNDEYRKTCEQWPLKQAPMESEPTPAFNQPP
jgi:WD40 repeat protein